MSAGSNSPLTPPRGDSQDDLGVVCGPAPLEGGDTAEFDKHGGVALFEDMIDL